MSGPPSGKYWIRLALGSEPSIGVDAGPAPVKPVITEGVNNIWTVTKTGEGIYTLTLEEAGDFLFIQNDNGKLVGRDTPPPSAWSIRPTGQDGGPYTIEVPGDIWPSKGWTVIDPLRGSPVTISYIEIPLPNQKWNFVRWPGPE